MTRDIVPSSYNPSTSLARITDLKERAILARKMVKNKDISDSDLVLAIFVDFDHHDKIFPR